MIPRPAQRARATFECAVDVVCLGVVGERLCVLLESTPDQAFRLPGRQWTAGNSLDDVAASAFRSITGRRAEWCEQVGATSDGEHPDGAALSVTFVAGVPRGPQPRPGTAWASVARLRREIPTRHRAEVASAVRHTRANANSAPIALSLLPEHFTLGELQATYELLLGAPVYAASFRRWLRASALVIPSGELRVEQRGRPAGLYRRARRAQSAAQAAFRRSTPV
jgi:ADP-ribose pyrophosphatase YjhB (NUDIX family)